MKHKLNYLYIILAVATLSSCGVGAAYVFNHNQNNTQVHLSENNYEIIERVTGSAEVDYIFAIGGLKKKQLYANAYSQMLDEANLNGSKAITNVVTEEHFGGLPPFYVKRTITVSGYVIEFTR